MMLKHLLPIVVHTMQSCLLHAMDAVILCGIIIVYKSDLYMADKIKCCKHTCTAISMTWSTTSKDRGMPYLSWNLHEHSNMLAVHDVVYCHSYLIAQSMMQMPWR